MQVFSGKTLTLSPYAPEWLEVLQLVEAAVADKPDHPASNLHVVTSLLNVLRVCRGDERVQRLCAQYNYKTASEKSQDIQGALLQALQAKLPALQDMGAAAYAAAVCSPVSEGPATYTFSALWLRDHIIEPAKAAMAVATAGGPQADAWEYVLAGLDPSTLYNRCRAALSAEGAASSLGAFMRDLQPRVRRPSVQSSMAASTANRAARCNAASVAARQQAVDLERMRQLEGAIASVQLYKQQHAGEVLLIREVQEGFIKWADIDHGLRGQILQDGLCVNQSSHAKPRVVWTTFMQWGLGASGHQLPRGAAEKVAQLLELLTSTPAGTAAAVVAAVQPSTATAPAAAAAAAAATEAAAAAGVSAAAAAVGATMQPRRTTRGAAAAAAAADGPSQRRPGSKDRHAADAMAGGSSPKRPKMSTQVQLDAPCRRQSRLPVAAAASTPATGRPKRATAQAAAQVWQALR